MARALLAIGRMSPCSITRFMCSSGSARTHTVKQDDSNSSMVPGSVTMLPLVAMTKCAVLAQHVFQRLALGAAEGLLAEHVEDLAQWRAAAALDLAVELDEGHVEPRRQQAAERRLAAAAQADQRDAPAPQIVRRLAEMLQQQVARLAQRGRRQPFEELAQQHQVERRIGAFVDELGHRQADGARDPPQQHDRDVAFADLELGQIALRHLRVLGQHLARHAALVAQRAHALAEAAQIGVACRGYGPDWEWSWSLS